MRSLEIDAGDLELVERASALLVERFVPFRHHVAAALRLDDGEVVLGLHIGSRRVNVCAEQIALGTALSRASCRITAAAAVIMFSPDEPPAVTSPCGVCRELLAAWSPEMSVLVDDDGMIVKTSVSDLLPAPWRLPAETDGPPRMPGPVSTSGEHAHDA